MSAVMSTYGRYDLAFEKGEGAYLFASDGRRYLDFAAGMEIALFWFALGLAVILLLAMIIGLRLRRRSRRMSEL